MLVYVYDGSFEGLLTAVYDAYYRKERPDMLLPPSKNLAISLLDRYENIATDREKSAKVYNAVQTKISKGALEKIFHVFLSNNPDKGILIYNYLQLGFKYGSRVDNHLQEKSVFSVHQLSRKVTHEYHRFLGFLRFAEIKGGIFYAKFEPDHDITMLLAPHFADRLSDQNWIIHDAKREIAAAYNKRDWIIRELPTNALLHFTECENIFRNIWKEYFQNISIAERRNLKQQKSLMPTRYWKNIIETL